jgi:hypothetical protein
MWHPVKRNKCISSPVVVAKCHIDYIYAEVEFECIMQSISGANTDCAAKRMRNSTIPHPARDIVPVLFSSILTTFGGAMAVASGDTAWGSYTLSQRYLNNTADPLLSLHVNPARNDLNSLSCRLTQLVNTYFNAAFAPSLYTGNFSSGLKARTWDEDGITTNFTGEHKAYSHAIYVARWPWLVVFTLASLALLMCTLITVLLTQLTNIPDILGYASSLTRDSVDPHFPTGGSAMDGIRRVNLLGDIPVRLGDLKPDEQVGYLAFAGGRMVQRAESGRLYS